MDQIRKGGRSHQSSLILDPEYGGILHILHLRLAPERLFDYAGAGHRILRLYLEYPKNEDIQFNIRQDTAYDPRTSGNHTPGSDRTVPLQSPRLSNPAVIRKQRYTLTPIGSRMYGADIFFTTFSVSNDIFIDKWCIFVAERVLDSVTHRLRAHNRLWDYTSGPCDYHRPDLWIHIIY